MFINIGASTKFIGSEDGLSIEIDDEEWNEMSAAERADLEEELLNDYQSQIVDVWTTVSETPEY